MHYIFEYNQLHLNKKNKKLIKTNNITIINKIIYVLIFNFFFYFLILYQ